MPSIMPNYNKTRSVTHYPTRDIQPSARFKQLRHQTRFFIAFLSLPYLFVNGIHYKVKFCINVYELLEYPGHLLRRSLFVEDKRKKSEDLFVDVCMWCFLIQNNSYPEKGHLKKRPQAKCFKFEFYAIWGFRRTTDNANKHAESGADICSPVMRSGHESLG